MSRTMRDVVSISKRTSIHVLRVATLKCGHTLLWMKFMHVGKATHCFQCHEATARANATVPAKGAR